MSEHHHNS